jgi:hypothetical protein
MGAPQGDTKKSGGWGLAAVGGGALMVGCCAGLPIAITGLAALGAGAVFGIIAGAVMLMLGIVATVLHVRKRRRAPASGSSAAARAFADGNGSRGRGRALDATAQGHEETS